MFDPMGMRAVSRMLQDHARISKYTTLKALSSPLTCNGPPMSSSEQNAMQLLSFVYPNNFTARVSLDLIFDQDDIALEQYFIANFKTVMTRFRAKSLYKIRNSLIKDKEADFIVCTPAGSILYCLEIDGPTHRQEPQKACDLTKNAVFHAHSVPVYRVTNAEIDAAHSKPPPDNSSAFKQLLRVAQQRWLVYTSNPSIKTLQIHIP